jgi:hypothetical protein
MPCSNYQTHFNNATNTLSPGCFNSFNPASGAGSTITMSPGVYYLNNTSLSLVGQTRLVGTGVTIILTGTTPGTISMGGTSSMSLTAPTSGTYANMLIIQSPNAAAGNNNTINGDNNSMFDGSIYFPRGDINFTGSSANATQCAMIVSLTVEFSGNNNLQNDPDDCEAAQQVSGKTIRLIA